MLSPRASSISLLTGCHTHLDIIPIKVVAEVYFLTTTDEFLAAIAEGDVPLSITLMPGTKGGAQGVLSSDLAAYICTHGE